MKTGTHTQVPVPMTTAEIDTILIAVATFRMIPTSNKYEFFI